MFEFTEDKKGIRPKMIGTIKNNFLRRTLIVLATPPTFAAVFVFNILLFILITIKAAWHFLIVGTWILAASAFQKKTWESWSKPRETKTNEAPMFNCNSVGGVWIRKVDPSSNKDSSDA